MTGSKFTLIAALVAPLAFTAVGGAQQTASDSDWHVYSMTQPPKGPSALLVAIPAGQPFSLAGTVVESEPDTRFDPAFSMETRFFEKTATLTVPVRIAPGTPAGTHTLRVTLDYQICSHRLCLPPATAALEVAVAVTRPSVSRPSHSRLKPSASCERPATPMSNPL